MTEAKLVEILQAISDDVDHDRIGGLLKIISSREDDIKECERQLHNAWKGNKELREELDDANANQQHQKYSITHLTDALEHWKSSAGNWKGSTNYWRGRTAYWDKIAASRADRADTLKKEYQDSLRIYIEDAAELRAHINELEDQLETLENPSLPDEPFAAPDPELLAQAIDILLGNAEPASTHDEQ